MNLRLPFMLVAQSLDSWCYAMEMPASAPRSNGMCTCVFVITPRVLRSWSTKQDCVLAGKSNFED